MPIIYIEAIKNKRRKTMILSDQEKKLLEVFEIPLAGQNLVFKAQEQFKEINGWIKKYEKQKSY